MWIEITLLAGCLQTIRNSVAKSLAGKISPALNSWSRFTFNLPFSVLLVSLLVYQRGLPGTSFTFLGYCCATAVTQLLGNIALVAAFQRANFAQSIVFHKLEVLFTAILGALFFSEWPSFLGWIGVWCCGGGILLMNLGRDTQRQDWRRAFSIDTGAAQALACAFLLVIASFMLKEAVFQLRADNPEWAAGYFAPAAYTLFHTTWIEVVILTVFLWFRKRQEFYKVRQYWQRMALIGFTGFAGSLGWYWAFSLTLVAYVKAVGQIEAILSVGIALFVWKEKEVLKQIPGVCLIVIGIVLVLL